MVTPLDRWCWFLRHGAELNPDHLPATLDIPAIRRAVEILNVFSHNVEERERYESRRKAESDRVSELRDAEERGHKEGLLRGDWIGRIRLSEEILQLPPMNPETLDTLPMDELIDLAQRFKQRVQRGVAP